MGDTAIETFGIGKRYRIGGAAAPYRTLRESLVRTVSAPVRRTKAVLTGRAARTSQQDFWALRGIDLQVPAGSVLGVVGRNGSGKSTLLKILSRISPPTEGEAFLDGRVGSLLEVGTGFHPELTGRENISLNGAILGMGREEIRSRFDDIVAFSEISRFLDTPVKHYSSGMYVRLAFSVAAHLDPEILLVDEVLAVGDAAFQRKCIDRIRSVASEGRTVMFVSHNMSAVRNLCQRGIWLDGGVVRQRGPVTDVVDAYLAGTVRSESLEDVKRLLERLPRDPTVRVDHVDVRQGGRSTTLVGNGERIELVVDFTVKRSEAGLRIYWDLLDGDRNLLIRTFHDDQAPRPSAFEAGTYRSVAVLPADLLAPHSYELRLHATVYNVRQCLGEDGVGVTLDVQRTNDLNRAYPSEPIRSKLHPRITWETRSVGPIHGRGT